MTWNVFDVRALQSTNVSYSCTFVSLTVYIAEIMNKNTRGQDFVDVRLIDVNLLCMVIKLLRKYIQARILII